MCVCVCVCVCVSRGDGSLPSIVTQANLELVFAIHDAINAITGVTGHRHTHTHTHTHTHVYTTTTTHTLQLMTRREPAGKCVP